jgi:hypothetical protein
MEITNTLSKRRNAPQIKPGVTMPRNAPIRIQLSRAKGWRMPDNTVKVDRTTEWGNPFKVSTTFMGIRVADQRHAFVLYRSFAAQQPKLVEKARAELRGKNLACWCKQDDPYEDACHAAVLLQIANSEGEP